MTKKILSIIPARGGSKGLLRKNIINLAGMPLIFWTIKASLNSKYITDTMVSSDDDEILNVSKQYGAKIIKRPKELADDESSSEAVVKHVLEELSEQYDFIILLQPTSPLRDVKDIDNAFNTLFNCKATALISVCKIDNKILKAFVKNDNGFIGGISNNQHPFMRRQDLPLTYLSNGAIYITQVDEFVKNNSFFSDKTVSYLMSDIKSIDIDTKEDLDNASNIVKSI